MDTEFRALFEAAGLAPTAAALAYYERLRALVVAGNERMNLTRLVEPRDFWAKHVIDSLLPFVAAPALRALRGRRRVADLGSGAGFPGLVVAYHHPTWRLELIERTQKKAAFLRATARELGLANVEVHPCNAREARLGAACQLVLARAVGPIADVCREAAPLLAPGGIVVHYKGGSLADEEVAAGRRAAERLGWRQEDPVPYVLPSGDRRCVVLSRSSGRTRGAARRPRRATRRTRGDTAP